MIAPWVAATFFAGNLDKTCLFLNEHGYVPEMLSKSRFNRRLDFVIVEWH